ncbi:MAG TPA: hypothetical protein VHM88_03085, partial [Candidatus Acidoferrales bacterium]|nr:hypothetical protein [Candidatus Acidoferrales bacterium]
FEQELVLPQPQPEQLELSSVLLSSQLETVRKNSEVQKKALGPQAKLKVSPLEVSGERIVPSVTHVFTTQQQLHVLFQAYIPHRSDGAALRAGLVFFRNGERCNGTPLVSPAEVDATSHTAAFRINLPLEKLMPGRYTVQAVVVEAGGEQAAFARTYFALQGSRGAAPGAAKVQQLPKNPS